MLQYLQNLSFQLKRATYPDLDIPQSRFFNDVNSDIQAIIGLLSELVGSNAIDVWVKQLYLDLVDLDTKIVAAKIFPKAII